MSQGAAFLNRALPEALLRRVEEAGLNATAPPQQRWMDGWIVRTSPGKAKRARCINAIAPARGALDDKLARCATGYAQAGLPLVMRLTAFSEPPDLDAALAARGWACFDDVRVMVLPSLSELLHHPRAVAGLQAPEPAGAWAYATAVGQLRGSPSGQIDAHAQRLENSPVPYCGLVWRDAQGQTAACGQWAREDDAVGLYDVFVAPAWRGQGLARSLCSRMLSAARTEGARFAYLQVEADNHAARAVYRRLGFVDGYGYHYRSPHAEV